MKKIFLFILAFISLSSIAFSQCEKDVNSPFGFPDSFDNWERGKIVDYEKDTKGLGSSANYEKEDAITSLYFYNRSLETIEEKDFNKEIDNIFEDINYVVEKGIYIIESPAKKLDDILINDTIVISTFTLEIKNKTTVYSSYIYLASVNNYFIKVRLSFLKEYNNNPDKFANDFVTKLYTKVFECSLSN